MSYLILQNENTKVSVNTLLNVFIPTKKLELMSTNSIYTLSEKLYEVYKPCCTVFVKKLIKT